MMVATYCYQTATAIKPFFLVASIILFVIAAVAKKILRINIAAIVFLFSITIVATLSKFVF